MTETAPLRYPSHQVVGIIDTAEDMQAAVDALTAAGFDQDRLQVLCGFGGLQRLDADGSRRGLLGRLVRVVENFGPEREQIREIERELREGHFGVGIQVADERTKRDAARILSEHSGHSVYYYGEWSIEEL